MELTQFLSNKEILSWAGIEKETGVPSGTIKRAMSENKPLPPNHAITIRDYLCTHLGASITIMSPKPKGKDVVDDITHYDLIAPNTYAHKKTGEVFKINYHDGAFRFL